MPHGATLWAGNVAGEQGQTCPWHGHLLPVPAQAPKPLLHLLVPPMQALDAASGVWSLCWGWGKNHPSVVLGALRAVLSQPFDPALPCDAVSFVFIPILPWFSVCFLISLKDAILHPSNCGPRVLAACCGQGAPRHPPSSALTLALPVPYPSSLSSHLPSHQPPSSSIPLAPAEY